MSTLLQRAQALLASKSAQVAVLAITPLASAVANAQIANWSFESAELQHPEVNYGGQWETYPSISPTVSSTTFNNGLKLFGSGDNNRVFSMTGDDYIGSNAFLRGNRLLLTGSAALTQPWNPATFSIPTSFKFSWNLTADSGAVQFYEISTTYELLDASNNLLQSVGSSGATYTAEPGQGGADFRYVDGFGGDPTGSAAIRFTIAIYFDWVDYSVDDSFDLFIEPNSIDIEVVPAPAAAALLGFAGLAAVRRRRA